ncbi:apoptosis-inducing factor 3-like [Cyclospora cayetanensis]|uniref:Apoptosis-inducing factor 3-like n=1 Tax=Cyclospora cayetanensis TaxID=88456 RepID=A0A6P6RX90_9EIME|nr:apoptosis-inducing factor 3-like [Cyclospora cayetanensis]
MSFWKPTLLRRLGAAALLQQQRRLRVGSAVTSPLYFHQQQQRQRGQSTKSRQVALASAVAAFCFSSGRSEVPLGDVSDFPEGGIYEVTVNEAKDKVLVAHMDGKFYCTGATCPHYGAPLVKGVATRDHVTCPWHDAKFDFKTGKCIAGPVAKDIQSYPVTIKGTTVFASLPPRLEDEKAPTCKGLSARLGADAAHRASAFENRSSSGEPPCTVGLRSGVERSLWAFFDLRRHRRWRGVMTASMCCLQAFHDSTFVVVGGGAAASAAVEELRALGFRGKLVMISREELPPYDRIMLSKNIRCEPENILLRPREYLTETLQVDLRLGETVQTINADTQTLKTNRGHELHYDKHVVVGSSFIGVEIAAALKKIGVKDVTVVGRESVPFERALGQRVGGAFKNLLESNNVTFIPEAEVAEFMTRNGNVIGVKLNNGNVLAADRVVVGVGVTPDLPAIQSSTPVKQGSQGGLLVDPLLSSASHPTIFAAGDIASFPYVKSGQETRVEHYATAMDQGRAAAANMLGLNKPFTALPFFWTMVFGKGLRYIGNGAGFEDVIIEGDLAKMQFVAYYTKGEKVIAAATMGKDPVCVAIGEAMQANIMPTATELRMGLQNSQDILNRVKVLLAQRAQAQEEVQPQSFTAESSSKSSPLNVSPALRVCTMRW